MRAKDHNSLPVIDTFDFRPGRRLAGKYEVQARLGAGWEGEVYQIRECTTGIERAAKFFFPHRNPRDKAIRFYAQKLHKLSGCSFVIHYYTQDTITFRSMPVSFLVSEYVRGELLSDFLKRQPGRRLTPFQAIHLLHALARGMECIHRMGEYHGDLHTDNIIVCSYGLEFELKLLDFYSWGASTREHIRCDTVDMIHVFYEALGGRKHYSRQPAEIKAICRGLKRSLILKQYRTAGELRAYLETMKWT